MTIYLGSISMWRYSSFHFALTLLTCNKATSAKPTGTHLTPEEL